MRATFASLLVTTLVLSSAPVRADEPAKPTPPTKQAIAEAKKLVKDGTKLYNVQQYEKAAELYQQAYLLDPRPEYLYASAQSQRLGGDCAKALMSYQAYLRANPPEGERAKAEKNIERCEQEIREREAAVSSEQIQAPYEVPTPPPPPPEEPKVVPPPPPPPPEKSYVLGHIMLGLGVGAVAGGSYLFLDGRNTIRDHNMAPTYGDYIAGRADMDAAKQKQMLGLAVIGGGAALMTGAIIFYIVRSGSSSETPPPVSATVSPTHTTLTFTGTF